MHYRDPYILLMHNTLLMQLSQIANNRPFDLVLFYIHRPLVQCHLLYLLHNGINMWSLLVIM